MPRKISDWIGRLCKRVTSGGAVAVQQYRVSHNEELYGLQRSENSRSLKWAGHVARTAE